jgi:hypothetical protein
VHDEAFVPSLIVAGEYSNLPLEDLIEWINVNVPREASLAGEFDLKS